jgi:large subunit ribosomal protein L15
MVQKLIDAGKLDAKKLIDHDALKAAGLARGGKDGVRLLGKGELKAKASFKVAGVSKGAIARRSRRPAVRSSDRPQVSRRRQEGRRQEGQQAPRRKARL